MAGNEAAVSIKSTPSMAGEDSSESEGETEPAKSFHRRFSTNKNIKSSVCTREGFLMKQTSSFQRWRRRYFKLKGRTLYYAKDTKSAIFDEINLPDLSVAECSTKNANHSFQVITPFRSLVLCAESRREMEEWITALKAAANKEYYDSADHHDFLSGRHNWYATSHAKPAYCNVCREALSGVTSHGLSCEVCKFKSHKRCAVKAINNCKWTTLASVGKDIIEDEEGNIAMPHQWMEGNLPVSAKCSVCDKTCGSVLRLQDWRCLWCRAMVHTACRPNYPVSCPLGPCRVSIVPPTALHSVGTDEAWEAVRPQGCSPLLVFVNSKSGDNQGVKFLRRFKQLLNPAQVFDLMNGGPGLGLRLFRHFDPFRILICSGDGSVGWVLSEIDKLQMHKQCQIGVLPLGTGNDLARVIGWGAVCDDDAHLPQLLERYEKASVKMLDRWSIITSERSMPLPPKVVLPYEPITAFEDSIVSHLSKILQSDEHTVVISSAKTLCETIKDFINKMASLHSEPAGEGAAAAPVAMAAVASGGPAAADSESGEEESINQKCRVLSEKLDQLLSTLHEEASPDQTASGSMDEGIDPPSIPEGVDHSDFQMMDDIKGFSKEAKDSRNRSKGSAALGSRSGKSRSGKFSQREALMSRANSLKKAVRQIIEHAERALDEQNAIRSHPQSSTGSIQQQADNRFSSATSTGGSTGTSGRGGSDIKLIVTHSEDDAEDSGANTKQGSGSAGVTGHQQPQQLKAAAAASMPMALLQLYSAIGSGDSSSEPSPCPSPIPVVPSLTTNFPLLPTSPIRYPHPLQPVFYRMATPPNVGPAGGRGAGVGRTASPRQQDSTTESEGDEDREAMLSLQTKLNAISPVPDNSENGGGAGGGGGGQRSCEFDFSALALPVPLEFADTDSLQDVPIDVFEDDVDGGNGGASAMVPADGGLTSLTTEPDEEPAEVEVKPIRRSSPPTAISVSVVVEPPSSEESSSQQHPAQTDQNREEDETDRTGPGDDVLGERIVEGAEEPVGELQRSVTCGMTASTTSTMTTASASIRGEDVRVRWHEQTPPPTQTTTTSTTSTTTTTSTTSASSSRHPTPPRMPTAAMIPTLAPSSVAIAYPPHHHPSPTASRRISSGCTLGLLHHHAGLPSSPSPVSGASGASSRPPSPEDPGVEHSTSPRGSGGDHRESGISGGSGSAPTTSRTKRKMPIINPLVSLPMWPNVETGGLISKVLLANADALCAAVSPLMDVEEDNSDLVMDEKCVMNSYFGIGIDAKITLDFHMKREEHPEKCRSRARNYMWYGVLGGKELLQKSYKNLEQRVLLECDGTRIPLPSLQGIVVLNIPSFMGGANFWGGHKEDDCFIAPSFDDRVLEVVAVFGSAQMAASRIINLQHHRIAQCHSVKITILGEEGVPVQVDGEAWVQPPGLIRIVHKNRMQMLCRNRALERSLEAWQEKQQRYSQQPVAGQHGKVHSPALSEEENQTLISFLEATTALVRYVRLLAISQPDLDQDLYSLATQASTMLDKMHPGGKIIEGPSLRLHLTDLVNVVRQLHLETDHFLKERASLYNLRPNQEKKLASSLSHVVCQLRKCSTDVNGLVHFVSTSSDEVVEKKSRAVLKTVGAVGGGGLMVGQGGGSSGGGGSLFRLKFRRPESSSSSSRSSRQRHHTAEASSGSSAGGSSTQGHLVDLSQVNIYQWGIEEVAAWLESIHLEEYRDDFIRHDIRGPELLTLERRDLKELGIHKVGHIKRLQQAIWEIKENLRSQHQQQHRHPSSS